MILVDLDRVTVARPDRDLFRDLSLTIATGDRIGVVGINGGGKSTLLRVIAGLGEPEDGSVRRGRGARVGFLDQEPDLGAGTVGDAVGGGWEVAAVLEGLGMGGRAGALVSTLSGGERKRVALARLLANEHDLLVLDEPTNHLDIDAITWLEARLAKFTGGLVVVTHDRHVLDAVSTRVLELDRGRAYVHEGGYASWLEARFEREAQAAQAESTRRNLARKELAWLRRGAPARTRKPKARIEAATAIVTGRAEAQAREGDLDLVFAGTPRLGDKVVELEGVGHRFGDGPWLVRNFTASLEPGGRLGIVGPNGAGKSTLLDVIAGVTQPLEGAVDVGPTVRLAYHRQGGIDIDPGTRVRDAVAGPAKPPGTPEDKRLMERFWFDDDAQFAPIGTLSGGERRRLELLLTLAQRPNLLLLDEPTNDLDLDTLRALEDFLDTWPGSLVVVSHDRAFLERVVEDVVAFRGDGVVTHVPGGYEQWDRERKARRAPAPVPAAPKEPAAPRASGGKLRSPSTLRRLLGQAEKEMETRTAARDAAAAALGSTPGSDHVAMGAAAHALADAEEALAAAEEKWLALAEELGA